MEVLHCRCVSVGEIQKCRFASLLLGGAFMILNFDSVEWDERRRSPTKQKQLYLIANDHADRSS